jgi:dienelactone hydrolase
MHRPAVLMITALLVGSFVSCSDDEQKSSTTQDQTTVAVEDDTTTPTTDDQSTSATSLPATSTEPWDLLYISDSSGWEVGEVYAELAADELGVEVRLIDWRVGGLSMLEAIRMIADDPQTVADAEIIVLWANPIGAGIPDSSNCVRTPHVPPTEALTVDDWAPFGALFEQAFADIWAARDGVPVVLRATDLYVPILAEWEEFGATEVCTTTFETMSDAIRLAAESSGATMVSAFDALNGPNHDIDFAQAGYLSDDMHLNAAGGAVVAEALAAEGFEPSQPASSAPMVKILRDQSVGDLTTVDVYLPRTGEGVPVVVMLHGTGGERSELDGLARQVAASGALVYLPTWPVITERPDPQEVGEIYRRQTEAVVCSLRHARSTAGEFGGDPDNLTLFGHSGGATVGARVALVSEPVWSGIDCYPGVAHAPTRFITTAGDFTGAYSFALEFPEQYRPFDVFSLSPTNDVVMRMFQGFHDWNLNSSTETTALDQHLASIGVDSQAAYLDSAHGDLIDVSEPAGQFMAGQVVELVRGDPGVFSNDATAATLSYEDGRCSYDGPTSLAAGEPVAIEMRNRSAVSVLFWMVGFEEGFDVVDAGYLDWQPKPLDAQPAGVETGRWLRVGADTIGMLTWVLVRGHQQWVPYCFPEPGTADPEAGLMHVAPSVLTMLP